MSNILKSSYIALALTLGLGISGCTTIADAPEAIRAVQSAPLKIDLKAGQVLQVAMLSERKGEAAKAVRARYFKTAIPHAASLGDKYLGNMRVKSTLLGQQNPRAIALWLFPDKAAQDTFRSSPKWPDYVQMRRDGWEELHVYSATVSNDMTLNFDPEKDYTFAAAWTRPNTAPDYQSYLDGIEANFDDIGARYVARFEEVDLQSTVEDVESPSHLTLVEWRDGPDLKGLQNTAAYKANAPSFQKAITRFDFYWVHFPIPA